MPKLTNGRLPKMRHHKIRSKTGHPGYAMVTLSGQEIHLGRWDDPGSEKKYNEVTAQWLSNGRKASPMKAAARTIDDLCDSWVAYAKEYYQKGGRPTSEVLLSKAVVVGVKELFGSMEIEAFGSMHLELLQRHWIRLGLVRGTVNAYTRRVKAMFKWGSKQDLVSAAQWYKIFSVDTIGKGRFGVKDSEPVEPATDEQIDAVVSKSSDRLAAMVKLQRLTGMRPGEVCRMRACDIDRSGELWVYSPKHHKTDHHGIIRSVVLGPKSQEILKGWIDRRQDPKHYLFSRDGEKPVGIKSYCQSTERACTRGKVEVFTPNQIRHTFATEIVNDPDFSIKDAQVSLGHEGFATTERYVKKDLGRAATVAAKLG